MSYKSHKPKMNHPWIKRVDTTARRRANRQGTNRRYYQQRKVNECVSLKDQMP